MQYLDSTGKNYVHLKFSIETNSYGRLGYNPSYPQQFDWFAPILDNLSWSVKSLLHDSNISSLFYDKPNLNLKSTFKSRPFNRLLIQQSNL